MPRTPKAASTPSTPSTRTAKAIIANPKSAATGKDGAIPGAPVLRKRKPAAQKVASVEPVAKVEKVAAFSRDAVAQRAYELFMESGGQHGRDVEHWLAAERELRGKGSPRRS